MENLVGRRVLITLVDDGKTCEGTLRSVGGQGSSAFTFSEVVTMSGLSISGVIHLRQNEIASLKPVGPDGQEETTMTMATANIPSDRRARPLMLAREDNSRRLQSRGFVSRDVRPARDDLKNESMASQLVELEALPSREMKGSRSDGMPHHFFVVDKLDGTFDEVMWRIWSEPVIGVAFEGVRLSRHGTVGWMQVSTNDCIYLFDILTLTDECMCQGLSDLLTSSRILKVIHDCRYISDMLFHLYNVRLTNVFDTQAADLIIHWNSRGGELPNYVSGLNVCLSRYLNVRTAPAASEAESSLRRIRACFEEEDESAWLRRPAIRQTLVTAAENVLYLLPLYKELQELLLSNFTAAVHAYMHDLRQCPELPSPLPPRHMVPQTVKNVLHKGRNTRWGAPQHRIARRDVADGSSFAPSRSRTPSVPEGGDTGHNPPPNQQPDQPLSPKGKPSFDAQKATTVPQPRRSGGRGYPIETGYELAAAGDVGCRAPAVRPCLVVQPLEAADQSVQPVNVVARRGLSQGKSVQQPLPGIVVDGLQPYFLIPMSDNKR